MDMGCSFTGHRIIKEDHLSSLDSLVYRAVEYAYNKGCRRFYTGGAIGFDTVCAKEIIRFKISHPDVKLILLLPCIDQDAKWNEMMEEVIRNGKMEMRVLQETNSQKQSEIEKLRVGF